MNIFVNFHKISTVININITVSPCTHCPTLITYQSVRERYIASIMIKKLARSKRVSLAYLYRDRRGTKIHLVGLHVKM